MKCVICKEGESSPGRTSLTLERGNAILVFKNVPAQICANCGESYMEEEVGARLLESADEAARAGVLVEVREYEVAPAR